MAISYKMLPNFLSADICDKILENIPPPNYDTMPSIDRSVDLPPLNTWYRMEKIKAPLLPPPTSGAHEARGRL